MSARALSLATDHCDTCQAARKPTPWPLAVASVASNTSRQQNIRRRAGVARPRSLHHFQVVTLFRLRHERVARDALRVVKVYGRRTQPRDREFRLSTENPSATRARARDALARAGPPRHAVPRTSAFQKHSSPGHRRACPSTDQLLRRHSIARARKQAPALRAPVTFSMTDRSCSVSIQHVKRPMRDAIAIVTETIAPAATTTGAAGEGWGRGRGEGGARAACRAPRTARGRPEARRGGANLATSKSPDNQHEGVRRQQRAVREEQQEKLVVGEPDTVVDLRPMAG